MRKNVLAIVALAATLLLACNQKPAPGSFGQMDPKRFVEMIGQDLDLSDEQADELTEYFKEKFEKAPKPTGERPNLDSLRKHGDKSHRPHRFFNEDDMAEFKKVLTSEQYSKMEERMNAFSNGRPGEGRPQRPE